MAAGQAASRCWLRGLLAWAVFSLLRGEQGLRPRLLCVTFMNRPHRHFAYLQVSAEAHSLHPQVIGYGQEAWWPDGLGVKINALRDFVHSQAEDHDVVLFVDAFDVLLFGGAADILARFELLEQQSNRSIFLNAEEYCFPRLGGVCDEATYPPSPTRWRYLNSGAIIGRGHALKALLRDSVPNVIEGSDQMWYQQRFRSQEGLALDTGCVLMCGVSGITEEHGVVLRGPHLVVLGSGAQPLVVHFPGVGHWPAWDGWSVSTGLHDAFRLLYPSAAERLLDFWRFEVHLGSTHTLLLHKGAGWWWTMRSILCIQCRLLGSREHECEAFPSLLHWRCLALTSSVLVLLAAPSLWCVAVRRAPLRTGRNSPTNRPRWPCWHQLWPASLRSRKLPELVV